MAKEYAVRTAILTCEYGSQASELKTPYHRHIFVNGNGLGNVSDITSSCVGCFGNCCSPYQTSLAEGTTKKFFHVQETREFMQEEPCQVQIEIPWQNPQSDVYAAYCNALLEDCWTVCKRGFGIISITYSGQSPASGNQKMIDMLKELEKEVDSFMEANGIDPSEKSKLMESILLWNTYGESGNLWDRISDKNVRAFATYLKAENPALYNFFERDIIITDRNGQEVDLNYFIGMIKTGVRDDKDIYHFYDPAIADNAAMLNAYIDAANLRNNYYHEIKDASWSKIINELYGDGRSSGTQTDNRFTDYINSVSDELMDVYPFGKYGGSIEERKIWYVQDRTRDGLSNRGYDSEQTDAYASQFGELLTAKLESERSR